MYVLADVERPGKCKIGRASNSTTRTSQMKTGNLGLVRVFAIAVANDAWAESTVHKVLEEYHLSLGPDMLQNHDVSQPSEWFAVSPSMGIRTVLLVVEKYGQLFKIQ